MLPILGHLLQNSLCSLDFLCFGICIKQSIVRHAGGPVSQIHIQNFKWDMLVLFAWTVQVHPQIRITPTIVSLKFWYGAWGKNLSPKSRSHHLLKHTLSFLNTPRLGVCIDQCCIGDNIRFNVGKLHLRAGPEWPVRYSIHLLSESCIPSKASSCTSKLLYSLLEQVFQRKWSPKIQKRPLWKAKFVRSEPE